MVNHGRRSFLGRATVLVGGLVAGVVLVPAARVLTWPAGRRVVDGDDGWIDVAAAVDLVPGGPPRRVEIVAPSRRDAWARQRDVPVGAAWLVVAAAEQVAAFSTACPHLGCSIDYDRPGGRFRCPCHDSAFGLDGRRLGGPAKRDLDPLEARVDGGRVLLRFVRFLPDTADRVRV